jgi:hypothetical protein
MRRPAAVATSPKPEFLRGDAMDTLLAAVFIIVATGWTAAWAVSLIMFVNWFFYGPGGDRPSGFDRIFGGRRDAGEDRQQRGS